MERASKTPARGILHTPFRDEITSLTHLQPGVADQSAGLDHTFQAVDQRVGADQIQLIAAGLQEAGQLHRPWPPAQPTDGFSVEADLNRILLAGRQFQPEAVAVWRG